MLKLENVFSLWLLPFSWCCDIAFQPPLYQLFSSPNGSGFNDRYTRMYICVCPFVCRIHIYSNSAMQRYIYLFIYIIYGNTTLCLYLYNALCVYAICVKWLRIHSPITPYIHIHGQQCMMTPHSSTLMTIFSTLIMVCYGSICKLLWQNDLHLNCGSCCCFCCCFI